MFYLRLNKLRIIQNGVILGTSEIQLMSFVTLGDTDFPMLDQFYSEIDDQKKRELVAMAVTKVISSRVMPQIQRIKDNQAVYFGDTGYNVFVAQEIPQDLNWLLLAIRSNQKMIDNATLLTQVLTEKNLGSMVGALGALAGMSNPVTMAVTTLSTIIAESVLQLCANAKDHQLGLFLSSYVRQEHYPNGKRDAQNVNDTTGNMLVDYTIFGF